MRLMLFVHDASPIATRAQAGIQALSELIADAPVELEIIDVQARPDLAAAHGILATPTLLKLSPAPTHTVIGDMTDVSQLAEALHVELKAKPQNGQKQARSTNAALPG